MHVCVYVCMDVCMHACFLFAYMYVVLKTYGYMFDARCYFHFQTRRGNVKKTLQTEHYSLKKYTWNTTTKRTWLSTRGSVHNVREYCKYRYKTPSLIWTGVSQWIWSFFHVNMNMLKQKTQKDKQRKWRIPG
jgi:hypothetical protein